MGYQHKSLERAGWRTWIDENASPNGWGADEFDILYKAQAPVTVFMRIWNKSRPTMEKYLAARAKDSA